ncbi:UNVERIFIED_CONTAM: hypothetical protein FKN15_052478 [Acipenser sinensis]
MVECRMCPIAWRSQVRINVTADRDREFLGGGAQLAEHCLGREGLDRQGNPRLTAHQRPLWPIGSLWFCSGAARSVLSSGTIGLVASMWVRSEKNDGLAGARFGGCVLQPLFPELDASCTGVNCLIQFEDFANANAFHLLNKYRNKYCTFSDDIQGTAAVAVAVLATLHITKNKLSDHKILLQGAGEGRAVLTVWRMYGAAGSRQQPRKICLSVMAMAQRVMAGGLTSRQKKADERNKKGSFASGSPFDPVTLPDGHQVHDGAFFASGSPFDPVTLPDGHRFYPGQGNNAYVFIGVALGVFACGVRQIFLEIFLITAEVEILKEA